MVARKFQVAWFYFRCWNLPQAVYVVVNNGIDLSVPANSQPVSQFQMHFDLINISISPCLLHVVIINVRSVFGWLEEEIAGRIRQIPHPHSETVISSRRNQYRCASLYFYWTGDLGGDAYRLYWSWAVKEWDPDNSDGSSRQAGRLPDKGTPRWDWESLDSDENLSSFLTLCMDARVCLCRTGQNSAEQIWNSARERFVIKLNHKIDNWWQARRVKYGLLIFQIVHSGV